MTRWPILCLVLAGCATQAPAVVEPQAVAAAPYSPVPRVVADAARVQRDAAHAAATRDNLGNAELLRMLELSRAMRRDVQRVRRHRTAGNVAAARASIRALREFTEKGKN